MKKILHRKPILRPILKHYAWLYIIGIVTLYIVDYAGLFIPQLTGQVTDGLADHTLGPDGVLRICLEMIGYGAVVLVGRLIWRYCIFGTARKVERDLRNQIFQKLETLSQS